MEGALENSHVSLPGLLSLVAAGFLLFCLVSLFGVKIWTAQISLRGQEHSVWKIKIKAVKIFCNTFFVFKFSQSQEYL
jgi:hypothetical protein